MYRLLSGSESLGPAVTVSRLSGTIVDARRTIGHEDRSWSLMEATDIKYIVRDESMYGGKPIILSRP